MKNRRLFKCLFLVLAFWAVHLPGYAQDVTREFRDMALSDVIRELEQLTDYSFIYESEDLRTAPRVTADFVRSSIAQVLSEIISPPLKYDIKGNIVAITKDAGKGDGPGADSETVIAGTVTDAITGEPVIGAAVWVKDTPIGVVTDVDGKYEMSFKGNYGYISVSYLGYLDQEIAVGKGVQMINVAMGGTLIQDIACKETHHFPSFHMARNIPGTFMYEMYGEKMKINSGHHQALKRLADGFRVSQIWCADETKEADYIQLAQSGKLREGSSECIIEAVYHESLPIVGLQWHPEMGGDMLSKHLDLTKVVRYFYSLMDHSKS